MPDGLSYPDQIHYLELKMLYHQYYQKMIDRETAKKEKKKLLGEYRRNQFQDDMGKHWVKIIRETEIAMSNFRKNPCIETAEKICESLSGIMKDCEIGDK